MLYDVARAELRVCWLLRRRVVYFCKAVGAEEMLCDLNGSAFSMLVLLGAAEFF